MDMRKGCGLIQSFATGAREMGPPFSDHTPSPNTGTNRGRRQPGQGADVGPAPRCRSPYQCPWLGMLTQGSAGAFASPFCNSSIDTLSGERTKAIRPSRGGRLISTPFACRCAQVA